MGIETMPARFQMLPELGEIIDFAVVYDGGQTVARLHRLITAGEIDDLQPHGAERNVAGRKAALLVGPSVNQRASHSADDRFVKTSSGTSKPGNAAHQSSPSSPIPRSEPPGAGI